MAVRNALPVVHTTDRETFKRCRLRWYFSSPLRLGYKPLRTHRALAFGSHGHAALDIYYGGNRDINAAIRTFQGELRDAFFRINDPTEEDEETFVEDMRLGTGILEHYGRWAPTVDRFKTVWTENTYKFPITVPYPYGTIRAMYSATPDALVEDEYGRLWIMEHKFYDKLPTYGDDDWLLMDEQVGAYIWTIVENTGTWPEGVIYNIIRKKVPSELRVLKNGHLSTDNRVDTTYELAKAQIERHYDGIPASFNDLLNNLQTKGNRFFFRQNVRRTKTEITRLAQSIRVEATEMLNPDLPIYRNPSRFNCNTCPYVAPCLAYYEGSAWETILEGNYTRESTR